MPATDSRASDSDDAVILLRARETADAVAQIRQLAERFAAEGDTLNALNMRMQAALAGAVITFARSEMDTLQTLARQNKTVELINVIGTAHASAAFSLVSSMTHLDRHIPHTIEVLMAAMMVAMQRSLDMARKRAPATEAPGGVQ